MISRAVLRGSIPPQQHCIGRSAGAALFGRQKGATGVTIDWVDALPQSDARRPQSGTPRSKSVCAGCVCNVLDKPSTYVKCDAYDLVMLPEEARHAD
jgi:hypothetical protein